MIDLQWAQPASLPSGIVIASNAASEWMLSWWFDNYFACNDLPVAVVDLGMSESVSSTALQRSHTLVAIETGLPDWFNKPFAILQSPFESTLWIDLDCQVKGPLLPLFQQYQDPGVDFAIREDKPYPSRWLAHMYEGEKMYNSGVIFVRHGVDIVVEWAKACYLMHGWSRGDQDVLSRVLFLYGMIHDFKVQELPQTYNHLRLEGPAEDAVIYHWTGPEGKSEIKKQVS